MEIRNDELEVLDKIEIYRLIIFLKNRSENSQAYGEGLKRWDYRDVDLEHCGECIMASI